jgi:copper(I)-binding protein
MSRNLRRTGRARPLLALCAALFGTIALMSGPAAAQSQPTQDVKHGDLTISAPWTRATPGGAKVAGGYLKITNAGSAPDRLIGGSTDVAGRIEVHEMSMTYGVMRMRQLASGLEIKPAASVELSPGGYHLMFVDLKRRLSQGETVAAKLRFEKAGTVDVTFRVGSIGEGAGASHKH